MFHSQEVQSQQSILPSDLTDQSKYNKAMEKLTKQKPKVRTSDNFFFELKCEMKVEPDLNYIL